MRPKPLLILIVSIIIVSIITVFATCIYCVIMFCVINHVEESITYRQITSGV